MILQHVQKVSQCDITTVKSERRYVSQPRNMMHNNAVTFSSEMMEDEAVQVNKMMRKIKKAHELVFTTS